MKDNPMDKTARKDLLQVKNPITRNAIILALFAFVSTGLIAFTHLLTKDRISKEIELSLTRQISHIVPEKKYTNNVYQDCLLIEQPELLGTLKFQKVYRMRKNQQDYALMITNTAPDGYSGEIDLAVAISTLGEVLGVSILAHKETPGLGDKIDSNKSDWLKQFTGLSLTKYQEKDWKVNKDGGQFDALTGATITPRAVVKSVYKSLLYFDKQSNQLFNQSSDCYANIAK